MRRQMSVLDATRQPLRIYRDVLVACGIFWRYRHHLVARYAGAAQVRFGGLVAGSAEGHAQARRQGVEFFVFRPEQRGRSEQNGGE